MRDPARMLNDDETWVALGRAAERLTALYCEGDTLEVFPVRERHLTVVNEGLRVWDKWTDYFEVIRRRRPFGSHWVEVQALGDAIASIENFFRERPDLAGFDSQ